MGSDESHRDFNVSRWLIDPLTLIWLHFTDPEVEMREEGSRAHRVSQMVLWVAVGVV